MFFGGKNKILLEMLLYVSLHILGMHLYMVFCISWVETQFDSLWIDTPLYVLYC